jgi:hypothetical protein
LSGFFIDDEDNFMWKGLSITFKRSPNDENALVKSSITHHGKVVLRTMEIKMPVVGYDFNYANQLKLKLLENPEVSISFHAYQCIQKSVSGKRFDFDLTTQFTLRQFGMPEFVVVLFQTNRI